MHCLCQALQSRGTTADSKSEKQLTTLLSIPLDTYNVVTVLSLKNYPNVMNLLATSVRKVGTGGNLLTANIAADRLGSCIEVMDELKRKNDSASFLSEMFSQIYSLLLERSSPASHIAKLLGLSVTLEC